MAAASEGQYFARLSELVLNEGTAALRMALDAVHPPDKLQASLQRHRATLEGLRPRVLKPPQWELLFPSDGTAADSANFDITLLCVLLRNICSWTKPRSGWDALPPPSDKSREASMVVIKAIRNTVYGHRTRAEISEKEFHTHWARLSDAVVNLGVERDQVDRLKVKVFSKSQMEDLKERIFSMAAKQDDIYNQVVQINDKVDAILSSHSEKPCDGKDNHGDGTRQEPKLLLGISSSAGDTIWSLLNSKEGSHTAGIRDWKDLAIWFDIDKEVIDKLENTDDAGRCLVAYLMIFKPHLTIDDFSKGLAAIGRSDVAMVLEPELATNRGVASQVHDDLLKIKKWASVTSKTGLEDVQVNARKKGYQLHQDNPGGGNCMFHALLDQLQRLGSRQMSGPHMVRQKLVDYLERNSTLDDGTKLFDFVSGYPSWSGYLDEMRQDRTWGDHLILLAAANLFERPIMVITSLPQNEEIVIKPSKVSAGQVPGDPMVLGHVAELHYVSLEPLPGVDANGWTLLHLACAMGNVRMIQSLPQNELDIDRRTNAGETPLLLAAKNGSLEVVRLLLSKETRVYHSNLKNLGAADLHAVDNDGNNALHMACVSGDVPTIEFFLGKEFELESVGCFDMTPLMIAVYNGNLEAVQLLVDKGADIHAKAVHGLTAAHWAAQSGDVATLKLLKANSFHMNEQMDNGKTPAICAVQFGKKEAAEYLLSLAGDQPIPKADLLLGALSSQEREKVLATRASQIPLQWSRKICALLNKNRGVSGGDYQDLGDKIGLETWEIKALENSKNPTDELLQKLGGMEDGTVAKFVDFLKQMERFDVIEVIIKEWIESNINHKSLT